ncbi:MAG: pyridoxal phosphate enzyme (YggS family) [Candidatus Aldehydirespiratoraceae bacterium]|jgi:pyridoxal phosphate enzyme (YggS family)
MIDPTAVAERLVVVRATLSAAAAGHEPPRILAVTKAFGRDAVDAAVSAGLADVGESYAQECIEKFVDDETMPTVHFIGGLQRNKIRKLAAIIDVWQSVDRLELAAEIAKRAPGASIMVQVDLSNEPTKGGCAPAAVPDLVLQAQDLGLQVIGLMGIAPLDVPEAARPGFSRLRSMVDTLGLAECSMGMSSDLEIAVEEGSTMVRVGTGLFGPRPIRSKSTPTS